VRDHRVDRTVIIKMTTLAPHSPDKVRYEDISEMLADFRVLVWLRTNRAISEWTIRPQPMFNFPQELTSG
jgi:hypothetical protein